MADTLTPPWPAPERRTFDGRYISLVPTDPAADAAALYGPSHESEEARQLWRYLYHGPFDDVAGLERYMSKLVKTSDTIAFTVRRRDDGALLGMNCLLAIVPEHGRAELGSIWYLPAAQRTKTNTEACYLLLRHLFEDLGYRRAEWKCHHENVRSQAAARRLGFVFEGVFRQHTVCKGANRDTHWFSIIDSEWPERRANLEAYLYGDAPSLSALNGVTAP